MKKRIFLTILIFCLFVLTFGFNEQAQAVFFGLGVDKKVETGRCSDLDVGDLFKVPNASAVYVVNDDGTRLYFPNEDVFYTWYSDFSGLITIPNECVDNYPAPNKAPFGMNYQQGSKLVKTAYNKDVYAIGQNNTRHKITSENVARSLYSDNWASLVATIPDVFWPNYSNIGTEITDVTPHNGMVVVHQPIGTLEKNVYYVNDGRLLKIKGGDFFNSIIFENGINVIEIPGFTPSYKIHIKKIDNEVFTKFNVSKKEINVMGLFLLQGEAGQRAYYIFEDKPLTITQTIDSVDFTTTLNGENFKIDIEVRKDGQTIYSTTLNNNSYLFSHKVSDLTPGLYKYGFTLNNDDYLGYTSGEFEIK